MSRPPHIIPLDIALDEHMRDLAEAEANQREVFKRHAAALAEVERATEFRRNAYTSAKACEQAIQKLGYCVMQPGALGGIVGKDKSRLDGHPGDFRKPVETEESADA